MTQQTPSSLDDQSHQRISDAVAAAEANSAGEIVTILADQSDDYGDVALAWSAVAAFGALTIISIWPEFYLSKLALFSSSWNTQWTASHAFAIATVVATLKFGSAWLLLLWRPLRMALVPGPVRKARVHERAIAAFRIGAERRTRGRTGILIYLSMREHRAEIVADETIATRVDPQVWGDALAAMLVELKQGHVAEGMCAAVERVGTILALHLPRDANDENELPNRLIEL